jgi:hypothetical protein
VVVAGARDVVEQDRGLAVRGDPQDAAALELAPLGDVEGALEVAQAGPRPVVLAAGDLGHTAARLQAEQPRDLEVLAVGVPGLDDIHPVLLVGDDAGGVGEAGGDGLDNGALPAPFHGRNE